MFSFFAVPPNENLMLYKFPASLHKLSPCQTSCLALDIVSSTILHDVCCILYDVCLTVYC
jgi:hypothetical protein